MTLTPNKTSLATTKLAIAGDMRQVWFALEVDLGALFGSGFYCTRE
jgi:hypothetical protein